MRTLAATLTLGLILLAQDAQADVSSWLAVGGGYGFERNSLAAHTDRASAFSASLGVGTSPNSRIVVGGIFRSMTHFSLGTDVGLAARVATGGFARGDWGLALDTGVVGRFWRSGDYGRLPMQFVLTGGGPWGLQVGVGAELWNLAGSPQARGAFAVLELDLLRLTVMRQGSTEVWWKNPAPAGGHLHE